MDPDRLPPTGLAALFRPRSVAIVGASRRAGSVGGAVLANLLKGGFEGPVYPVNRRAEHVLSVPAWPDLRALPEVPDLVIVAVPPREAVEAVREAAERGVPAACVLTAGFGEVGGEGKELELKLVAIARAAGMALLGPNCLGVQNTDPKVSLDATFSTSLALDGRVAFASQSGALGLAALDYGRELGLGFSLFASLGNKAMLSGNDFLEHLEHDPRTRVVLLYLESFGNPLRFREIAARVGRHKPIALVKGGRTGAGARAAGSHTGALAGPDQAVTALCKQSGVIRAETLEDLFGVAQLLVTQPLPRGRRVAVVTNAGGPGILVADALEAEELHLPPLSPATREALRARLRPAASVQNPIDVLADAGAEEYGAALRAALADPAIDAVAAIYVPPVTLSADEIARAILAAAEGSGKPVLTCFLGTKGVAEALRAMHQARLPCFRFPEAIARSLSLAVEYAEWRAQEAPQLPPAPQAPAEARTLLAAARTRLGPEGGWLSTDECGRLGEAWGLPLASARRVPPDGAAALAAARELGLPVVLKAEAPGLLHKTESGAVQLDLRSEAQVVAAARRLLELAPTALVVQRQIGGGAEWLVGAVREPRYGPLVTVGAGGVRTELWRDVEARLAPLTDADVQALLDTPRFGRTLAGFRSAPPGDREALARFVRRLSECILAHGELAELEANPVLVLEPGQGAVAVDLRARLGPVHG